MEPDSSLNIAGMRNFSTDTMTQPQQSNHHNQSRQHDQNGLNWLRQRAVGGKSNGQNPMASIEAMRRIKLESRLEGHTGCVNCLEWNQAGNLLASGSDDRNVIIWEPFKGTKRNVIKTGHEGNIFSVKFIPDLSDTLIATCASDGKVKLIDIVENDTILNCETCHLDRVKRLVTHPNEPHLIWSSGEEGYIMQYDIREEHRCSSTEPKNLLIDLRTADIRLSAKCLAINPIRDEMLAIGSNDAYIRLFDRRYMHSGGWNSCTAYFTPGHLIKPSISKRKHPSFGTTYLSFSPDGTELLANIHAEQVYMFNTHEPWEPYKSFEETIKPLILDFETTTPVKTYSLWRELKKSRRSSKLPEKYSDFHQKVRTKLASKTKLTMEEFDRLNQIIAEVTDCVELYNMRARALIQRAWRGDYYQAIRDCCCAFALDPLDYSSLENITIASQHLGDKEARTGLREIIKLLQQDLDKDPESLNALSQLLRENSPSPTCRMDLDQQEVDVLMMFSTSGDESEQFNQSLYESTRVFSGIEAARFYDDSATKRVRQERERALKAFDYSRRFCGHCNMNTDIKEVNFFGSKGKFVVAGSDDGAFYIWDKETTNIVKAVHGDLQILNCLQPHPSICMLATSGIEPVVKLWSPSGRTCFDAKSLEMRCKQNQDFLTSDPLDAMIMMLYPQRDFSHLE